MLAGVARCSSILGGFHVRCDIPQATNEPPFTSKYRTTEMWALISAETGVQQTDKEKCTLNSDEQRVVIQNAMHILRGISPIDKTRGLELWHVLAFQVDCKPFQGAPLAVRLSTRTRPCLLGNRLARPCEGTHNLRLVDFLQNVCALGLWLWGRGQGSNLGIPRNVARRAALCFVGGPWSRNKKHILWVFVCKM